MKLLEHNVMKVSFMQLQMCDIQGLASINMGVNRMPDFTWNSHTWISPGQLYTWWPCAIYK